MAKKDYIIRTLAELKGKMRLIYDEALEHLKATNWKGVKITTSELTRTLDQNWLIHAVFSDCAKLTGLKTPNWWKSELKCKIGLREVHFDIDEQPHLIVRSTTEYSTKEMATFCEKIVAYMKMNYDVDIILPDELTKGVK